MTAKSVTLKNGSTTTFWSGPLVATSRRITTVEMTQITPGGFLLVADPKGGNPRMYDQDGSMIARDGKRIRRPRIPAPSWWR